MERKMQRQKATQPPNRTSRFAVLVIDMQYDFLDEDGPVPCEGGREIIASLQVLLSFARGAGIPVIYT